MADVISVNVQTGEVIERNFTAEEIAEMEALAKINAEEAEAVAQREAQAAADRESGNQKLKDLGLTDDEIAALTS